MTDDIKRGEGHQCYDWYHYLWHLIAIGAVSVKPHIQGDPGQPEIRLPHEAAFLLETDAWASLGTDTPGKGEVIAQIDTGVNADHPNLSPRILPAVSFAAHPFGVRYVEPQEEQRQVIRGPERTLKESLIGEKTWEWAKGGAKGDRIVEEMIEKLERGRGVEQRTVQISRMRYSAHGTACAGLMVGAPAKPVKSGNLDAGDGPIPYWGVAPGAKLLPIEISAQPGVEQLILAFLYALEQKVSVIHFPREVPDPWRPEPPHRSHPGYGDSRYTSEKQAKPAWDYFEGLFEAISEEIPIVCAAGNNGYDHLIYPASKATEDNGVIAVGALTYCAKRSAYSNYSGDRVDNAPTISAPSDDQEVYTRHQVRLDTEAARSRDHNFEIHGKLPHVEFAPQGVLTTDIPGHHGYSSGQLEGIQPPSVENLDRTSLYTVFGGTSAASALVAGAVALLQSKRPASGKRLTGSEVKAKLKLSGAKEVRWPWLKETPVLIEPDYPNGEKKDSVKFDQQFGAGLLDLHKLLS